MSLDPISLTVLQRRLEGIANEMSLVLRKTAYSPNIKERADFSCAIFDNFGNLIAQAEAIPVHLGSMPFVASPVINIFKNWGEGDAIITNSPRSKFGGTHLPDITLLSPVFMDGKLAYVVANRAHHADVGGMVPGSLPANSTEIFQEGIIIPPVKLYINGKENEDVMNLILENVRTPNERRGDLRAQYSSLMLGVKRIKELIYTQKNWNLPEMQNELLKRSEIGTIEKIEQLNEGEGEFEDFLDSDGYKLNEPVKIKCKSTIKSGSILFDFTGSDKEQIGNCNAPLSVTTSACYYVVRLLTGRDVPTNSGCFKPIKIIAPNNTVINPSANAATSSANTETSSRIVDVVMGSLAKFLDMPSASQGTMNNLLLGGIRTDNGEAWSIYETIGGGTGAGKGINGTSAIQSHMTNTENTPIEALELTYPLKVNRYCIREAELKGQFKGGKGITREIELLDDAILTLQTERRNFAPWGQPRGENDGLKGENILYKNGKLIKLNGKTSVRLVKGDRIIINTPSGGGYSKTE